MRNSDKIKKEIHEVHKKFNISDSHEFNSDKEIEDFINYIKIINDHKKIEILQKNRIEKLKNLK